MTKRIQTLLAGALVLNAAFAEETTTSGLTGAIEDIFGEGKVNLDVRARYEFNDTDNGSDEINGIGVRTRLGFTTGDYYGFTGMVEMEDVSWADNEDRPPLDPETTEVNRLWLRYAVEGAGDAKLGRQIIALDDQRFIGHVGWRQNIQTFDAVTATVTALENNVLTFGYIEEVHRINATSQDNDSFFINTGYTLSPAAKVSGFLYYIDIDEEGPGAGLASGMTVGLRATGKTSISDGLDLSYAASFANQSDVKDADDFDNNYYALVVNLLPKGFVIGAGFEWLEGGAGGGFATPFATVHAFQGFADVFAGPSLTGGLTLGLIDYYAKVGATLPVGNGLKITSFYHYFETDDEGESLGSELDAVASYKINKYLTLVSKIGQYWTDDSEVAYGGTDKTVFTAELNFKY